MQDWARLCKDAQVLVTGWHTPPITERMLAQAARVRLVAHAAGSVKHLLAPSVFEHGIRVATANSALAVGVAETTLGMIISGLKGFDRCAQLTRQGRWKTNDTDAPGFVMRELFDVTVGLIGLGQVGRAVAKLLQAFEVEVLAHDPHASAADAEVLDLTLVDLPELLSQSDVVSLHAPALLATRHMLSRPQFALMRDEAIFINTARGSIVDEEALVAELKTGRISAILDVTDPEPPPPDHPFRKLPNVVLTPHIAGAVNNGCLRLGRYAVDQILAYAGGRRIAGEVTAEALAIMA